MNEWVWRNGGMILTEENWSTGRKTLYWSSVAQWTYRLWSRVPLRTDTCHPVSHSRSARSAAHSVVSRIGTAVRAARTWSSFSSFVFNYSTRSGSTFLNTTYPHYVSYFSLLIVRGVCIQVLLAVCMDCTCFVVTLTVTFPANCTDTQSPALGTAR